MHSAVDVRVQAVDDVSHARDVWRQALASAEMRMVARALEAASIPVEECVHEAAVIAQGPTTQQRMWGIINEANSRSAGDLPEGAVERFVLGHATLRLLDRLDDLPVAPAVKRLTVTGLSRFADRQPTRRLRPSHFVALCKIATARRFPAGQFDWEVTGLPRSWVPRIRPLPALARAVGIVALRWRGFGPAFFPHMPVTYPVYALRERDALKTYYRMAKSMAMQPEVKGLIASSWLHSPDTFAVSPHLAWLNRVFTENGAMEATIGPADPDCGVLTRSIERQRAFANGSFKPTVGLVIWPRREMLQWADRHPELDD
jgi:hypothetical protein